MRKIISLIMVLAMLLTALPVYAWAAPDPMAASGTCGDNLTWVYDEGTRTLTISGTGPMYDSPEFNPLMTPCQAQNVIVEEGVTSIGSMAFTYSAVTNIRLPASLTYISPSAFFYCYYLNYVEFLGNAPTISDNAFWETETTVFYPADNPTWTEAVGKNYEGTLTWVPGICNGRHSAVSIPATPVQCIVDGLTEGMYCSACGMVLREQFPVLAQGHSYENGLCVKCGKGVETYTGTYGENLTWVYTTDGSLRISGSGRMHDLANGGEATPWDAYKPYITNITIDSGVTSVGTYAFLSCDNLLTASLPQGLEAIGGGAFSGCRKLEAISLPDTLKEIGHGAFFRCASLKTIRIPGGVTKIPGQMVSECTGLTQIEILGSITQIGEGAFRDCVSLSNITIPNSVLAIGREAFLNCDSFTEMVFPRNVRDLEHFVLNGCDNLKRVVLPAKLETMGQRLFAGSQIEQIEIPAGVVKIDFSSLADCHKLGRVTFKGNAPAFAGSAFDNQMTLTAYYPSNDPTWTADALQNYGGNVTWVPYEKTVAEELADLVYTGTSPEEIRDTVQKIDTQTLQAQMAADTTNSGVVASLAALEAAAGGGAAVAVENPSIGLAAEDISVVGANLNGNGNVTLVVGQPEGNNSVSGEYDSAITVYFSMDLSNVEDTENLAVPVKITLPIPETMNPENVVILHYHANGTQETLYPAIHGEDGKNFASIVLTSFSDFAMTQLSDQEIENPEAGTTAMYRLFNPNSGEHFYTGSIVERNNLIRAGWNYENVSWNAPVRSGDPVYRLYNPNSGDHHYTMSEEERDMLVGYGWQYEGVCWNSASNENLPLYRLYNPNADCGSHHYTGSTEERDYLVSLGWIYEGIGWFGIP